MDKNTNYLPVKRKLFIAALGWICGLLLFLTFGVRSVIMTSAASAAVIAVFSKNKNLKTAALIALSAVAACAYFSVYNTAVYKSAAKYDGKITRLNGTITDIEEYGDSVMITVRGQFYGGGRAKVRYFVDNTDLDYYDNVTVASRVNIPENTLDFQSEDYLRSQGIFLEGGGRISVCTKTGGCSNRLLRAVKHLRDYTVSNIYASCGKRSGAFLTAILCSERSRVTAADKAAVYRSGLGHLFAVSGTHVVMICSILGAILSRFISSARVRSAITLAVVWGFAVFAGFSPSVLRACVMMSVSLVAPIFKRRADSANSLGLAALLITLQCPYALTSVSFLLSFTAAFAVGVAAPKICSGRVNGSIAKTFVSYICINVFSLPLCAYFFSEISIISVFANLILIPICTAALALSFIYMLFGCKLAFLIKTADILASLILKICSFATSSRYAYIGTKNEKTLVITGIFFIALIAVIALKNKRAVSDIAAFVAAYVAGLAILSVVGQAPVKEKIITVSDDAAVIIRNGQAFVFDMGSKGSHAYRINSLLCEYHVSDSYIFISAYSDAARADYEKYLSDPAVYFAQSSKGENIEPLGDGVVVEGFAVSRTDDGFKVFFDGKSLNLGEKGGLMYI